MGVFAKVTKEELRRSDVKTVFGLRSASVPPSSNDVREQNTEDDAIDTQDPYIVLALDDPSWQSNAHAHLLPSIWVAVQLEILSNSVISQSLVGLCELNVMRFDALLGLVGAEADLVRVELDTQALVMLLDFLFGRSSSNAENVEWIIDGVRRICR